MNQRNFKTLCSLLLLVTSATFAMALPEDRDKPIYGSADQTEIEANSGKTVLIDNVVIRQGLLSIFAQRMTLERNPESGQFQTIFAQGEPVKFIDSPNNADETVEVTGQTIEFYPEQNLIITSGKAQILMNGNSARGERIRYDTVTGIMTIESEKRVNDDQTGAQAQFILQPGSAN